MARMKIQRKNDQVLKLAEPNDGQRIKFFLGKHIWKGKDVDDIYQWKYQNNPMGETIPFIGINSESNVIATNFFMPWKLSLNGKIINAHQWVDLLVDLEYRGQPIPSEMLQRSLTKARSEGSPVCFAFPNNNAVPVHKKNNGIHLGHIVRYAKPLDVEYLVIRYIKAKPLSKIISAILNSLLRIVSKESFYLTRGGYVFEEVETCGKEFDDLWECAKESLGNKVIPAKDRAYLKWKYRNTPNEKRSLFSLRKNDKLQGFVVLEDAQQTGYIVDILAVNQEMLNYLIAHSIKHFRRLHKESVVYVALENNIYFNNFKRFGFVGRPDVKHFYIYLDDNMSDKEYFLDSKNWFITIGDCDVGSL